MKKLSIIVVVLFTLLLQTSCSNTFFPDIYIPVNSRETYDSTPPESVEFFITKNPSREYKEIGIITFPIIVNAHNNEKISQNLPKLREVAARYGANAVIRIDIDNTNIKGIAVRWK